MEMSKSIMHEQHAGIVQIEIQAERVHAADGTLNAVLAGEAMRNLFAQHDRLYNLARTGQSARGKGSEPSQASSRPRTESINCSASKVGWEGTLLRGGYQHLNDSSRQSLGLAVSLSTALKGTGRY